MTPEAESDALLDALSRGEPPRDADPAARLLAALLGDVSADAGAPMDPAGIPVYAGASGGAGAPDGAEIMDGAEIPRGAGAPDGGAGVVSDGEGFGGGTDSGGGAPAGGTGSTAAVSGVLRCR